MSDSMSDSLILINNVWLIYLGFKISSRNL